MPLADAFVSDQETIKSITGKTRPLRDLSGVDVKSVDVVKVGKLNELMTGKPFLEALREFPEHSVSDDGPWIYGFPPELQAMIARLTDSEILSTATRWAQIQEFALDRVDGPTVALMFRDIVRLARQAEAKGQRLYIWNSL